MTDPSPDPSARPVAVVTGATSGIGLEVARGLAAAGYRVGLVGRGMERLRDAESGISRSTGGSSCDSFPVVDLSEMAETRRIAGELRASYPKIRVLVNNAGAMFAHREVTREGVERTFALNVLSPFLLTSLLEDRLRAGAPSRVVMVSSAAHRGQRVAWDDLESAHSYRGYRTYGRSKLELLLLTREFAQRFAGSGVTVNAVHPGFVRSGFAQNTPGALADGTRWLAAVFGRSVTKGAETPLFVATDPGLAPVTGQYFSDRRVRPGSLPSREVASARRLFAECARRTGVGPAPI